MGLFIVFGSLDKRLIMIRGLWLFLLTGCMSNSGLETMGMTQENVWNLSKLCIGMNESQVLRVMQHPHTKKTITHEGTIYNIWFYVTSPTGMAQSRLVSQNLTPLTFANGFLKGWGFDYYHKILQRLEDRSKPKKIEALPQGPLEDKSLEKTIDILKTSSPAQTPKTAPAKPVEIISDATESKPKPKEQKPKSKKEKKSKDSQEQKEKKRDEAIQEDNDQNFDFW
jgi:type IV secretory pathway VirB10-like protein